MSQPIIERWAVASTEDLESTNDVDECDTYSEAYVGACAMSKSQPDDEIVIVLRQYRWAPELDETIEKWRDGQLIES